MATDGELFNALDKKYDALLDKLALEALEKQMGEAEWKRYVLLFVVSVF